jgi:hypothetical protein
MSQEAAVGRFPSAARRIADLIIPSKDFRSVCEDLAAAEHALAEIDNLPESVRDARRAGAEGWIRNLSDEVRSMLYSAKILPITQGRDKPKSGDDPKRK